MLPNVLSENAVLLFAAFFLPGFVSVRVYDLLVPGERRDFSSALLEVGAYSALNYALLFWPIAWALSAEPVASRLWTLYLLVMVVLIVAPAIWPYIYIKLAASGTLRGMVRHPTLKAWDFVFAKRQPHWVIVHLKDGRMIGGKFGSGSFASSSPAEEQLYVEQLWKLDECGKFQAAVEDSEGIVVLRDEIAAVELFAEKGGA